MRKRLIALLLACTMIILSACSASVTMDEDGNVSIDGVPVSELGELDDLIDSIDKEQTGTKEDTQKKDDIKDKVLTDLPTKWNLTELFSDEDAFEADMKRVEELIPEIKSHRGTLNSAEGILNYLEDPKMLEIKAIMGKADMYTTFLSSLDATDAWSKKAEARFREVEQRVSLAETFKEPEIMEMPFEKRQEIFSDRRLAPYAYYLKNYTDPDHVILSEEANTVKTLMGSAVNNMDTYSIFEYVERPTPTFTYPDGTEAVLTDAEFTKIMESKEYDHEFHREIFELRNAMRQPYANTYASLLEGAMRKNWAEAQINKYDSTLEAALGRSDVDPKVYDKTIEFAHSMLPKLYEYYEAKKKILGYEDEMMLCDMGPSVSDYEPQEISYEEAINIGRSGISVWGDEYLNAFDKIVTSSHIDVYPSDTKRTGAYETLAGNEKMSYVLYNFNDSQSYISTLVHELGHAVYSGFSAENQNMYNNIPEVFTHEVASTANELMFHKYMIEHAKSKEEKLYWIEREINLFLGNFFRQCEFSEFEDYCYKTIEKGGSLNAEEMSDKWLEIDRLYHGDSITITDDYGIEWARIPHFYYNYYVYQYATSATYAASVCRLADENGQEEIDAYLEFLKAGRTASPAELLSIAGVDPLSDDTYEAAGELIGDLIDEFIETAVK